MAAITVLTSTAVIFPCWLPSKIHLGFLRNLLCDESEQIGDEKKPCCEDASKTQTQVCV